MTDYFHVVESIPRPRKLVDTNDSLRAKAMHSMVAELDLTVTNTWMNGDTEQELFTRSSWSNREDSLTQMDFIMTSRKLEMIHVQVMDSDWFKTDHRAVLAVLSLKPKMRYTLRNGLNLRGWEPDEEWLSVAAETLTDWENWNAMVPLHMETAMAHRKAETKEMSVTEIELKITSIEKENRSAPRANRVEFALPSNLEKAESAEARETPEQDQGGCRDGESSHENAKQTFQLELDSKTRRPRICSHKLLPRTLLDSSRPRRGNPIRETTQRRAVENLRMDCAGGMLTSPKKLENDLKKLKNGKGSPDQITADVLKALPSECLEKLARSLSLMCWDRTFPEKWLCSITVMAPKVVGATCLTKFRPIAGLCAMGKVSGYVWLKSLPPLKYESVQTAFVPKTHADAGLFLLLQAAELSREWQKEIAVVQLDVKKAFDHVDH